MITDYGLVREVGSDIWSIAFSNATLGSEDVTIVQFFLRVSFYILVASQSFLCRQQAEQSSK
jgi:hypothetical protein